MVWGEKPRSTTQIKMRENRATSELCKYTWPSSSQNPEPQGTALLVKCPPVAGPLKSTAGQGCLPYPKAMPGTDMLLVFGVPRTHPEA